MDSFVTISTVSASLGQECVAAVDRAATACGRLSAAVERSDSAASDLLLIRHAVRAHDRGAELAAELLVAATTAAAHRVVADEYADGSPGRHPSIATSLERAGLGELLTDGFRKTLALTESDDARHTSSIVRAAIVAGALVIPSPASAAAQRGAALAGALSLVYGGSLAEPWLAPYRLDAAARSAAVQVDRSGAWSEWIRAWCGMLTREATTVDSALRQAESRLKAERAAARDQRRVGATDDLVLRWLHLHAAFTIREAAGGLGLTAPTVGTAIERLEAMGFATELTGQKRDRVWVSTTLMGFVTAH